MDPYPQIWVTCFAFSGEIRADLTVAALIAHIREKHPSVEYGQKQQAVAMSKVRVANTAYIPTLELNAVYTSGFPAGIINLSGVPGAAFRSGPAAGLVLKQNIWDFGRTSSSTTAAESEIDLRKSESEVQLLQVQEAALRAFFDCARLRDQTETWKSLAHEFRSIQKQVSQFVNSGQRSKVEEALANAQAENAVTKFEDFSLRYRQAKVRLAQIAVLEPEHVRCPLLGEPTRVTTGENRIETSPVLLSLKEEEKVAQTQKEQVSSQYNPRIFGLASYGVMQNRNAANDTYSVGIGLIVPLFTGLRQDRELELSQAQIEAKSARIEMVRNQLQETLLRLDEVITSSSLRKTRLRVELGQIESAFSQAKQRYSLLQGRLVDLREIVRRLATIKTTLVDIRSEEHLARALRANFLGEFH